MSDEEDYNSEEDQDYVPSEGEQVSEEENSGDEEDFLTLNDDPSQVPIQPRKKSTKAPPKGSLIPARKRKGGIKLDDGAAGESIEELKKKDAEINEEEEKRRKELAEQAALEEQEKQKEKEKKRADDLWSSFMSDVKPPPRKPTITTSASTTTTSVASQEKSKTETPKTSEAPAKVKITKVFDFAGEEIKITKEVDADSKEAKAEQKKQETAAQEMKSSASSIPSSLSLLAHGDSKSSLKRPAVGGLNSVLNKIGKKNKMGTLEKSKIDWDAFKTKEGIDEDLKIHNKGKHGYTERMAFLNRADQRQFELERDIRLGSSSKR